MSREETLRKDTLPLSRVQGAKAERDYVTSFLVRRSHPSGKLGGLEYLPDNQGFLSRAIGRCHYGSKGE